MREGRLQEAHARDLVGGGIGRRRRDDAPAEAVADEVDALHLRRELVDQFGHAVLADVPARAFISK